MPNGHHTTKSIETSPNLRGKFCPDCGEATFTTCQHCDHRIRGHYHVPGAIGIWDWSPPSYCHNCGEPYPWTERRLAAAKEMADEIEELSHRERDVLKQSISDLGKDGPQTELAAARYARLRKKIGPVASSILDKLVGAFASAAAKELLDF